MKALISHCMSAAPPLSDLPIADSPTLTTVPSMKARLDARIVVSSTAVGCFGRSVIAKLLHRDKQRVGERPFFVRPLRLQREARGVRELFHTLRRVLVAAFGPDRFAGGEVDGAAARFDVHLLHAFRT